jgi:hypothetical protein
MALRRGGAWVGQVDSDGADLVPWARTFLAADAPQLAGRDVN